MLISELQETYFFAGYNTLANFQLKLRFVLGSLDYQVLLLHRQFVSKVSH